MNAAPSHRLGGPPLVARLGEGLRGHTKSALEAIVTSSMVRWTWSDLGDRSFVQALSDFRPSDIDTVHEMMAGRYLLGAKLIDTGGVSPFALKNANTDWTGELQSFSWLRHFRDVRDPAARRFSRTLTLDWIGRYRQFDPDVWRTELTAQRVMNWLRHLDLITENANPAQVRAITRVLNQQVQSLRVRAGLLQDPFDALMARIALLGAALAQASVADSAETVAARLDQLHALLDAQIDADGLHKSRNPALQVELLTELVTVRQALATRQPADRLGELVERMHAALDELTLGTGELAYFNGAGQQQVDLLYALHAQSNAQRTQSAVLSGYGIMRSGPAVIIADSGKVPPPAFARNAHAGALSFEFSHGNELIVGNCGPAPAELSHSADLFRLGAAHSCPTIGRHSSASLARRGSLAGTLNALDPAPLVETDSEEAALHLRTAGFIPRYGTIAERWLTLISDGNTLVGKDRFTQPRGEGPAADITLRFHLGPGIKASRQEGESIIRLGLPSGAHWSFLWEGAEASLDDSVRQSAFFGFYSTQQIVLERPLANEAEVVWILTRHA